MRMCLQGTCSPADPSPVPHLCFPRSMLADCLFLFLPPPLAIRTSVPEKPIAHFYFISHPKIWGDCLSSLSLLVLFSFVRFILFIPSKCPDQLTVSGKSGTFALFTFTSKSDDKGRRQSKGESEAGDWTLASECRSKWPA